MPHGRSQRVRTIAFDLTVALFGLVALLMVGCADMELPSWVPFQGPASDQLAGVVTPSERIAELRKLSEAATSKGPEEKRQISDQLSASIRTEKDPLVRLEIIRALGRFPGPTADGILKAALNDDDVHVRIAACEAWGRRGGNASVALLADLLRGDVNIDVRLAAAKALGETHSPAAVAPLGEALADRDPAMQYQVVLSLEQATGKDFGHDVGHWQRYVRGERSEPPPSWAERIRHWF